MEMSSRLASGDPSQDLSNRELSFLRLLETKLQDELVARLSELAEQKVGRLTFYFAAQKLGQCHDGVERFRKHISGRGFHEKRNRDISHKEVPEKWGDHRYLDIPYRAIVRAVALALRLMKRIDGHFLGPSAPYLWREARKRRYDFTCPPPEVVKSNETVGLGNL
jgi:hypothetical protein